MEEKYTVVLVTVGNEKEAEKITEKLLEKKLAACVNIVPLVKSFFWWQGKIDQAEERLLIIKTKKAVFEEMRKLVKSVHSYTVPEIIALPIIAGEEDYLNWIEEVVSST
jgi:periplasmic divalent cation tolerance protein